MKSYLLRSHLDKKTTLPEKRTRVRNLVLSGRRVPCPALERSVRVSRPSNVKIVSWLHLYKAQATGCFTAILNRLANDGRPRPISEGGMHESSFVTCFVFRMVS